MKRCGRGTRSRGNCHRPLGCSSSVSGTGVAVNVGGRGTAGNGSRRSRVGHGSSHDGIPKLIGNFHHEGLRQRRADGSRLVCP